MEPQRIKTIVDWVNGRLERGNPDAAVSGIALDSRTVGRGELFVALAGERFDGHDYVAAALAAGAAGAIVSRPLPEIERREGGAIIIRVKETTRALADLARGYRGLFDLPAVAVTGSNGKTTIKTLTGQILQRGRRTLAAPASYNNLIGVSLTILQLQRTHQAAVFELGSNHPGEIRELARLCRPALAVVSNIGPAHIGFFGGLGAIAAEKAALLAELEGEKTAFLNLDDPRVAAMAAAAPGEVIGFGFGPAARIRARDPRENPGGVSFRVRLSGGEIAVESPLPGRHNIYNLLAALAVGDHFGVDPEAMRSAARGARIPPGRMERRFLGGVEIINDAYNANPASMAAALETWLQMKCAGRRIMVSGDMNELGEFSAAAHRDWGDRLGRSGIDCLIFLGPLSRPAAAAASAAGAGRTRIETVGDCPAAAAILQEIVRPGDSVLLKGSRKLALEEIIENGEWGISS